MIKFFRNLPGRQTGIRQNLLSKGKTGKPVFAAGRYLKYAIGEIVLVVIGILIALSINNWNEERKNKVYEVKMLSEISNSLKSDIIHFKEMIKVFEELSETSDYFMELSKNNIPYNDSLLAKVFQLNKAINYQYNSGPYEALKSSGIDKITNDSIRKEITDLFDFELPKLGKNIEYITRNQQKNIEAMIALFGQRHVDDSRGRNLIGWSNIPNDLFQSQGFLQVLAGVNYIGLSAGRQIKLALPNIEQTIDRIDIILCMEAKSC